jgi:hypothetical protein
MRTNLHRVIRVPPMKKISENQRLECLGMDVSYQNKKPGVKQKNTMFTVFYAILRILTLFDRQAGLTAEARRAQRVFLSWLDWFKTIGARLKAHGARSWISI